MCCKCSVPKWFPLVSSIPEDERSITKYYCAYLTEWLKDIASLWERVGKLSMRAAECLLWTLNACKWMGMFLDPMIAFWKWLKQHVLRPCLEYTGGFLGWILFMVGPLIFTLFGVIYPLGLLDCDDQIDDVQETKFISAMCQLTDGILDDALFNGLSIYLLMTQGSQEASAAITWLSISLSGILVIKRVIISYYNFVQPLQGWCFAESGSRVQPETKRKETQPAPRIDDRQPIAQPQAHAPTPAPAPAPAQGALENALDGALPLHSFAAQRSIETPVDQSNPAAARYQMPEPDARTSQKRQLPPIRHPHRLPPL